MKFLAVLDEAAFNELPDATVLGKDGFIKDEKTGTYKLAMDGTEAEKLATPLQTKFENKKKELDRIHEEKNEIAGKLRAFEDLGKSADEFETILKEGVTADTEKLTKEFNTKVERLRTENQRLIDAAKAEAEEAKTGKTEIEKQLIETIKRTKIAELKNEFDLNAVADHVLAAHIDVVWDEDLKKYVERVVENGEVAYKGTAFKTPAQLVEDLKMNADYAGMFNAGTGAGSGAPSRQLPGGVTGGTVRSSDTDAIGANLEKIASGEVKVV